MKQSFSTFQVLLAISVTLADAGIDFVEYCYLFGKRPEFKWQYKRSKGLEKSEIVDKLYSLNKQGLIKKIENQYYLTKRGRARFKKLKMYFVLNLLKGIKWNGIWYLLSFDISENFHQDRDRLRRILIDAGFIRIHQSLYVYPHKIEQEIKKISKLFPRRNLITFTSSSSTITKLVLTKFKDNKTIEQQS